MTSDTFARQAPSSVHTTHAAATSAGWGVALGYNPKNLLFNHDARSHPLRAKLGIYNTTVNHRRLHSHKRPCILHRGTNALTGHQTTRDDSPLVPISPPPPNFGST